MTASRILVVDDEADIRGLLKEILSEEGYEVEVAADATQARSSRATQVPDLVLLDIWMPDTDGITLLREWSVTDGYDCPVVMMSGHGTVETAVEATRLGAFDFVEKPLSLDQAAAHGGAGARRRAPQAAVRARARVERWPCPSARARSPRRCANRCNTPRRAPPRCCCSVNWDPDARPTRATCIRCPRAHRKPFFMVVAASLGADPAAALFGSERDGSVELGALDQAAGGSLYFNGLEDLNSEAQRALAGAIEQNGYTRVGGRAAAAAQRALDQFGAGRLRIARLAGAVSPRSRGASERDHPAGAAAARLRRGRARSIALLRRSPGRRSASAAAPLQRRRAESAAKLSLARQCRRAQESGAAGAGARARARRFGSRKSSANWR